VGGPHDAAAQEDGAALLQNPTKGARRRLWTAKHDLTIEATPLDVRRHHIPSAMRRAIPTLGDQVCNRAQTFVSPPNRRHFSEPWGGAAARAIIKTKRGGDALAVSNVHRDSDRATRVKTGGAGRQNLTRRLSIQPSQHPYQRRGD